MHNGTKGICMLPFDMKWYYLSQYSKPYVGDLAIFIWSRIYHHPVIAHQSSEQYKERKGKIVWYSLFHVQS